MALEVQVVQGVPEALTEFLRDLREDMFMKSRLEHVIRRVLDQYASFLMEEDRIRLTKHLSYAIISSIYGVYKKDEDNTFLEK